MNTVHFHLLVNHFPIIGGILATIIMLAGLIIKNETVKKTAYFLFIFSALISVPTFFSGEQAEETVEKIAGIDENMIEKHEEKADFALWSSIVTGVVSIIGLYLSFKNSQLRGVISFVVFLVSLVTIYFAWEAGESGGKIRHTEISNNTVTQPSGENHEHGDD